MNTTIARVFTPAAVVLTALLTTCCTSSGSSSTPPGQAAGAAATPAPPAVKKAHPFRGKVEKIDVAAKSLTVNGEDVEGWMGAMTMIYLVDKPEVLGRVAVGDRITATVYDGDFSTLHDVAVSAPEK